MFDFNKPNIEITDISDDKKYGRFVVEPLNPRPPALAHDRAFPCASVNVTIVLLKDDWM